MDSKAEIIHGYTGQIDALENEIKRLRRCMSKACKQALDDDSLMVARILASGLNVDKILIPMK